jgi:hypothetical protein
MDDGYSLKVVDQLFGFLEVLEGQARNGEVHCDRIKKTLDGLNQKLAGMRGGGIKKDAITWNAIHGVRNAALCLFREFCNPDATIVTGKNRPFIWVE